MDRQKIHDKAPDLSSDDDADKMHAYLEDLTNHFESLFGDIVDELDKLCVDNLECIADAKTIAKKANSDLY